MSLLFGDVCQNGYVVRDIEAAMEHWRTTLGIGPFLLFRKVTIEDFTYRGVASPLELSIALANDGDMQIELIEQASDTPSGYRDHLGEHGQVLHHTSAWTTDFDGDMARILGAGHRVMQSGRIGDNRLAYFETQGAYPSTTMELYDVSGRATRLNERVRDLARDWDGQSPVIRY